MISISHPALEGFTALAQNANLIPVVREVLADQDTPVSAYARLRAGFQAAAQQAYAFLLESVEGGENLARYSIIGGDPLAVIQGTGRTVSITHRDGRLETLDDVDPLATVESFMARFKPAVDPALPRFVGGAVGYIGYDAVAQFDRVPLSDGPGLGWPELLMMIVDTVVIFDQVRHTILLIANAYVEGDPAEAYADAERRLDGLEAMLSQPLTRRVDPVQVPGEAPAFVSNTTPEDFIQSVEASQEYIRAGDIIQVVLSQRFETPRDGIDPLNVYRSLRAINPSPYLFCIEAGGLALAGSSPEVHVRSVDRSVDIRPIAGTRKRGGNAAEDQAIAEELLADPKECAEHVMLVDLARNDIGRVCEWGSVNVSEFMIVERYSHVMHIVSNVRGTLDASHSVYDLLRATFPAGTLSGAPKIRAMEIIAEMEKARRGAYGGAVAYIGFDGNLDSCITIRTVLMDAEKCYVQAGAGVVADSVPQSEFEETCNKANGMLKAVQWAKILSRSPGVAGESV